MRSLIRSTTVITLICLLATASSAYGKGRFLRRNKCCVQSCQTTCPTTCNPCAAPAGYACAPSCCFLAIQAQPCLYYCNGPNGVCGIYGSVTITRQASDPAVTGVFLMVNNSCPSGTTCPGSGHYYAPVPPTTPIPTTYTVNFPASFPPGDPRIVLSCTNPSAISGCVVVKLADGTCRSFPFNGLTECVSGPMMPPCPECEFQ
jgi:hypothetical protein